MYLENKYFIYFLGYLWADGYIERNRIGIEILKDDAITIVDVIRNNIKHLKICTSERKRVNRKEQMNIYFCNVKFYDEFMCKYFIDKNISSPERLIEIIPGNILRYFYQGLIDGDGCFYFNKKNKTRQFYVTSSFEQDWSHMTTLFDNINITQYEVRKIINKNGNKSSYIRIKKYEEINKLFNYLYPNEFEFGLKRKYDKCKIILESKVRYSNKSNIDIDILKCDIINGLYIKEIAFKNDCCWRKIYNLCKKNDIKYPKGFFKNCN